jgi:hypothetical protein
MQHEVFGRVRNAPDELELGILLTKSIGKMRGARDRLGLSVIVDELVLGIQRAHAA